ncbi:class I SAM-dependent methyltransferase [Candidatus Omnitrophota bacterium]
MKEEDIRPAQLKEKVIELFEQDAADLLKYKAQFVEVDCPACATKNDELYFEKKGYEFKKCSACRSLYISPRPTTDLLGKYYSTSRASKFWQEEIFPSSKEARIKSIYIPRADRIEEAVKKYKMNRDLMVEVGAGSGFFAQEVAKRNLFKRIIIVEPGPIDIDSGGSIELINDVVENADIAGEADIVVNFELIEHVFSPFDFLSSIFKLMKSNSFLMMTTPNIEGFESLTLWERSTNIAGPDHINYFNTDSIKVLLERVGFERIDVSTTGELDVDIVRNDHLKGHIDLSSQRFLHYMLIEKGEEHAQEFQNFLQEKNLSSNMFAVAYKE